MQTERPFFASLIHIIRTSCVISPFYSTKTAILAVFFIGKTLMSFDITIQHDLKKLQRSLTALEHRVGRSLTMSNAKEIREQIQYWERRLATFQSANQNQQAALADFTDE